ncbi:annexin-like protein RJ4 [Rosa rugosa]|uniref:annexin-like protein RJ4 n=1 Tax=Rosa rugosa TaxID=74645 RepID=UPI002B404B10|nr:annexin-like protein RJ4 [Rosa rugosa]
MRHSSPTFFHNSYICMNLCFVGYSYIGWGTDEKAIICLLGHRNATQRKEIRVVYEQLYQEDIIKRLESELSGDFERAVYRWTLDPADCDAVLANLAIKKPECNYNVIIEIFSVRCPEELLAVTKAYQLRYKCSLEEDLAQHTNGDIRKLLVALVTAYRCDGNEINVKLANSEANILQDAIKDECFNHEEIIRILSTRSKTQFMATFNKYRDDHGNSISKNFLEDGANDFQKALHTAVRCLNDHKKCFEKVLRKAIIGTGTNEDALTRVIVTRAEKDLNDIMEVYYKKNSVPLEQAVAQDTSGDYKTFLLTLLGKKD